jgi:hypothetical protein
MAVIRIYDDRGNLIEMHAPAAIFAGPDVVAGGVFQGRSRSAPACNMPNEIRVSSQTPRSLPCDFLQLSARRGKLFLR